MTDDTKQGERKPCGHAPMQICVKCEDWGPVMRSRINGPEPLRDTTPNMPARFPCATRTDTQCGGCDLCLQGAITVAELAALRAERDEANDVLAMVERQASRYKAERDELQEARDMLAARCDELTAKVERMQRDIDDMLASPVALFVRCRGCHRMHDSGRMCPTEGCDMEATNE